MKIEGVVAEIIMPYQRHPEPSTALNVMVRASVSGNTLFGTDPAEGARSVWTTCWRRTPPRRVSGTVLLGIFAVVRLTASRLFEVKASDPAT